MSLEGYVHCVGGVLVGWWGGGREGRNDLGWWAGVCVSVFWDLVSRLSHKGPCGNVCIK